MRSKLLAAAAVLAAAALFLHDETLSAQAPRMALVGGTIYVNPTDAPIRNGVVLVEAGRIDTSGGTITAGFWNSHVHFIERKWAEPTKMPALELAKQLQSMLTRYGFTSVFDTGSMWETTRLLRERVESGEVAGPRIRSTGEAIFPRGGAGEPSTAQAAWAALGFMPRDRFQIAGVVDAPEARAAATKLLETGTDGLKLYAVTIGRNGISLTGPTIEALDEAHRRQKPVFAHPTTEAGLAAAVGGGVDVIVHTTPQSGPWSEGAATMMKDRRVGLIPTPALWRYELRHERLSFADRFEQAALDQLRAWLCAGGQVLFGTDVGYVSEYDPTGEYVLMAAAGMTFRQILASLTTAPTERFGESDRLGRIATGLVADLVVLQRDPGGDIRAFAAVRYTIRDGVVIYDSGSR